MKISKKSYRLIMGLPLAGIISFVGTPIALASECSLLSPCISNSATVTVSAPPDVLDKSTIQVTAPPVAPVTAPISQATDSVTSSVDTVTAPVADAINKVTAPIVDNAPVPVAPIVPPEPITALPGEQSIALDDPAASAEPVTTVAAGENSEIVTPADTKSVAVPAPAEVHTSSADSDGINKLMMLTPSLVDFQPASVHSSQGEQTKVRISGGFGFGHVNPVDDPAGFASLAFAYIIILGSVISLAVKRGRIPNFRNLISRI